MDFSSEGKKREKGKKVKGEKTNGNLMKSAPLRGRVSHSGVILT